MLDAFLSLPGHLWALLVSYLPGNLGLRLRYRYWKKRLRSLGKGVRFDTGIHIQRPDYVEIDANAWIDRNVVILAGPDSSSREKIIRKNADYRGEPGVVHIGRNVHVGVGCILSGISPQSPHP